MAEPRTAHGQRDRQQDRLIGLTAEPAELTGDVHVGGGDDAGLVELAQQTRGLHREARLEGVALGRGDGVGAHLRPPPSSSASLSAGTSPGGAGQPKTPVRPSSTTGPSAPVIPRTNRYTTPARLTAGS